MNIKSYKNLCKFCDNILFSRKSNIYTHAITNLHILKEHPVLLDEFFIKNKIEYRNSLSIFFKVFIYLKNFFFEESDLKINNKNKKKTDILLLSNLINKSHINKKEDFYFGDIENRLNKKGIKSKLIRSKNYSKFYTQMIENLESCTVGKPMRELK